MFTIVAQRFIIFKGVNVIEAIKPGRYSHFKGGEYEVLFTAKHSETLEDMVIYRKLYGDSSCWVRPASMWNETVEYEGKKVKRFEFITQN